jgi:hypothetical protein
VSLNVELSEIAQAISGGTVEKERKSGAYLPQVDDEEDRIIPDYWTNYEIRTSIGMLEVRVPNPNPPAPMTKSEYVRSEWQGLRIY